MIDNNMPTIFEQTQEQLNKEIMNLKINRNNALKEHFKKLIKPNLLVRLKEEILASHGEEIIKHKYLNLSMDYLVGFTDDLDFEICLDLSSIYWYLTMADTDDEKAKKNQDDLFTSDLKSRALTQCYLRPLVRRYNDTNYYIEHTPIYYSVCCLVNYMLSIIDVGIENKKELNIPNKNFKLNQMILALKTIRSILLLVGSDNNGSAFTLLRSLVEICCVFFTIKDNQEVADEYYKFMKYRYVFETEGKLPDEFKNKIPPETAWHNYLDYGWLDKLNRKSNKKINYVFKDLLRNADLGNKKRKNVYHDLYKLCCKFSHGNYLNQGIKKFVFLWILTQIGTLIVDLLDEFARMYEIKEFKCNNIDLTDFLAKSIIESDEIYKKCNSKKDIKMPF